MTSRVVRNRTWLADYKRRRKIPTLGPKGKVVARSMGELAQEHTIIPLTAIVGARLWKQERKGAALALAAASGSAIAAGLLFDVLMPHRFAPPGRRDPFEPSYPSGHALRASTFLLAAGYLFAREELVSKKVAIGATTALVAALGTDRLLLDRHWTTDVIAGWLGAVAIAGGSVAVYEATREPKRARRPRRKVRRT